MKQSHLHVFTDEWDLSAAGSMAWAGFDASAGPHGYGTSFHGEYFSQMVVVCARVFIIAALSDVCLLRNAINNFPSILNIFLFPPARHPSRRPTQ